MLVGNRASRRHTHTRDRSEEGRKGAPSRPPPLLTFLKPELLSALWDSGHSWDFLPQEANSPMAPWRPQLLLWPLQSPPLRDSVCPLLQVGPLSQPQAALTGSVPCLGPHSSPEAQRVSSHQISCPSPHILTLTSFPQSVQEISLKQSRVAIIGVTSSTEHISLHCERNGSQKEIYQEDTNPPGAASKAPRLEVEGWE